MKNFKSKMHNSGCPWLPSVGCQLVCDKLDSDVSSGALDAMVETLAGSTLQGVSWHFENT